MAPNKNENQSVSDRRAEAELDTSDYNNEPFINSTIASLGVLLSIFAGVLLGQMGSLYTLYSNEQQEVAKLPSGCMAESGRGVARLSFGPEMVTNASQFADRNEPFVCRSCLPPASLAFWAKDSNLLEVAGKDTKLPIRVAPRRNHESTLFRRNGSFATKGVSNYEELTMTLGRFLSSYNDTQSDKHIYAAQITIMASLPDLLPHIQQSGPPNELLEAIGTTPPISHRPLSLYLGHGPLTTQTHYDSLENIVCVMSGGSKTFELYDPSQSSLLLYVDRSRNGNGSPVDAGGDDEFPMAKYALPSTVSLYPGDCLYLPVYWYHTVTSSAERTLSINWWRMPNEDKMQILERLFCRLDGDAMNDKLVSKARAQCNQ